MSNLCLFCEDRRFMLNERLDLPSNDSVVWEDKNIFVAPDLFPLVVGHVLIVTKSHYNSFGNAPFSVYSSALNAIRYFKTKVFKNIDVIIFEHGAVIEHSAGSSIDHAHIHMMPFKDDIHSLIVESEFITQPALSASYKVLNGFAQKKQPYIFFQKNLNDSIVYPVKSLPSQFLRILIAQKLGVEYDWKLMQVNGSAKKRFLDTLYLIKR